MTRCRTAEQTGKHDFKQAMLDVCNHRNDAQANDVRIRIQGAINDLHAADAIYHKECYTLFIDLVPYLQQLTNHHVCITYSLLCTRTLDM